MSMAPSIRPSSMWSRGSKPSAAKSRGVPTCSSTTKSSSPPAGASSAARLGIDMSAPRHSSSAAAWAASAALTSAASVLVRASSSAFSSPCGLRDQLAELLLLGAHGLERRRSRRAGLRRRRAPGPRRPRTGRAWPGRRARGRGRLGAGGDRSWVQAIGRPASRAAASWRGILPPRASNHLARARSRTDSLRARPISSRHPGLGRRLPGPAPGARGAGRPGRRPGCTSLDEVGEDAAAWAARARPAARHAAVVEVAFGTLGMALLTVALAVGLLVRRATAARRTSPLGVMIATPLATTALKWLVGRDRPEWQEPVDLLGQPRVPLRARVADRRRSPGIVIVLVTMLVRRAIVRRLASTAAVLVALVVAADRVLLGRHYRHRRGRRRAARRRRWCCSGWRSTARCRAATPQSAEPLARTVPAGRTLAVILNPIKVEDVGPVPRRWSARWRRRRAGRSRCGTSRPSRTPAPAWPTTPRVAGADLVLVCGGDGTVREVCAELAGTGIPVGIVPAGTGNLLARNLDIPLYMRAADRRRAHRPGPGHRPGRRSAATGSRTPTSW